MLILHPITRLFPSQGLPRGSILIDSLLLQSDSPKWNAAYRLVRCHGLAILLFSFLIFREKLLGVTVFMLGEFRGKRRNLSSYIEITFISYLKKILTVRSSSILGLLILKLCMCDCEREVCVCVFVLFFTILVHNGSY